MIKKKLGFCQGFHETRVLSVIFGDFSNKIYKSPHFKLHINVIHISDLFSESSYSKFKIISNNHGLFFGMIKFNKFIKNQHLKIKIKTI